MKFCKDVLFITLTVAGFGFAIWVEPHWPSVQKVHARELTAESARFPQPPNAFLPATNAIISSAIAPLFTAFNHGKPPAVVDERGIFEPVFALYWFQRSETNAQPSSAGYDGLGFMRATAIGQQEIN